jgi:hypothetical protein
MAKQDKKRMQLLFLSVIFGIIFIFIFMSVVKSVGADNINPQVFSIDSKPYGMTYGQWTAKWFQWLMSIPLADNPAADDTGKNCGQKQEGPVWFLPGTAGGKAERTCAIPAQKAILFPIISAEYSYKEYPNLKTESELRKGVVLNQDKVTSLEASVDGMQLKDLRKYRVQSPLFDATFPKNNLFGVSAGPTQAVADGFWILLQPLSPGKHDIHFKGAEVDFTSTGTNSFATDVTYHLNVK